ncbi:S-adenosyl-L-methionine-dependent methyltransferase [Rhypophila sp. PSN 637]
MPPEYQSKDYWHARFGHETSFEWLVPSADFLQILDPFLARLPTTAKILQLGCGTSDIHCRLRQRGYQHITNMDYEPLAIGRSRDIENRVFGDSVMSYVVADATDFDLGETKFDLVIDKSTADAVACTGSPPVISMSKAVKRCLAEDGIWLSLSFSAYRYDHDGMPFSVQVINKIPTPKMKETDPDIFHYCYLLRPITV